MSDEFWDGFSVREPMWHTLGSVPKDYPGRQEAIRLAGHNWATEEHPIFVGGSEGPTWVPGWKALTRSDNGGLLHVAKATYTPVQNTVLWDIAEAIVDQPNIRYETGLTLKEGRIVTVLARLDEPVQIDGDPSPTYPYLLIANAHDGSAALTAAGTEVRVVCWNTYSMAMANAKRNHSAFSFRHTANVMSRIDEAKQVVKGLRQQHQEWVEMATDLSLLPVDEKITERFLRRFIPEPPNALLVSDRVMANIEEARNAVRSILAGKTCEGIAHSAYGLLQAGGEYLDYVRNARTEEGRFTRSMLNPDKTKDRLVRVIREVVNAA